MNIIVTLPANLINLIINGEKIWEVRKTFPRLLEVGKDGFFCLQKGTKDVICWCRVDMFYEAHNAQETISITQHSNLGVDDNWLQQYAGDKCLKLWKIGKVIKFEKPLPLSVLCVERAPQSFAYTPLSCGESF